MITLRWFDSSCLNPNHTTMRLYLVAIFTIISAIPTLNAQSPAQTDSRIYDIINAVSQDRIEADIRRLANFVPGTPFLIP